MLMWRLRSILALTWMEMLGISYCCGSLVISIINGIENFVQNEISSLCGRSMRATCSYGIKPMDFEDDLIDAHICLHTQKLPQRQRRATCKLHDYLACHSPRHAHYVQRWKLSKHPDNNCNIDDSLVVWPTEATRVSDYSLNLSHATTAGGVKTYL